MHVLVTGGAGFIGSHLVEYHLKKGDAVHAVDDLSTGTLANIIPFQSHPDFRFSQADILTWSELKKVTAWADRIYHMAAVVGMYRVLAEPIKVLATNIAGTERLLRTVKDSRWSARVLLASTSEVYGLDVAEALQEDLSLTIASTAQNRWTYAISKIADESLGMAYVRQDKAKITILRLFNTVGPRQRGCYGMVVPRFVKQAVQGEPLTVFGDGSQTRSFCDVRDTVAALDALANNPKSIGQIVNIGSDKEISIHHLALLVKELAASSSPITFISFEKAYGEEFKEFKRRKPDLAKFRSLTSFEYQWTLERTLNDLIATAALASAKNP